MDLSVNFDLYKNEEKLRLYFPVGSSADVVVDKIKIGNKDAFIVFLNGSTNTEFLIKIEKSLLKIKESELEEVTLADDFMKRHVPINDKRSESDFNRIVDAIFWSMSVLFVDGFDKAIIMDTKRFPSRSISEPEKNKTMRGPRDGFCENVYFNTALIRRRIKSRDLAFEPFDIGSETKTRVILAYMRGKCDSKFLDGIREKLKKLEISSLTLSQQTLTDALFNKKLSQKLNPFPKVRYVERPDTASSMLIEGKIAIMCDTTPSVIFIPVNLYDMIEETDDYYFPALTGSYLRTLRIVMLFVSVFLSPLWLLATMYGEVLPKALEFLLIDAEVFIPVWLQLIIVEIMMDALKIASLNTPNTISNSLSVVSGLLLSDFAVASGWLVDQSILYSAISSIANFIPTNYELSYAFKFWRITLLFLSALFGFWGFLFGTVLFILILISTKTENNKNYLFPFSPFDKRGIFKLFFRTNSGNE